MCVCVKRDLKVPLEDVSSLQAHILWAPLNGFSGSATGYNGNILEKSKWLADRDQSQTAQLSEGCLHH